MVTLDDRFDLLLAIDWQNLHRFADEIPLGEGSLLVGDVDAGEAPEVLRRTGARLHALALKKAAKAAGGAWVNMIALGLAGTLAGVPAAALEAALRASWKRSEESLAPNVAALLQGVAMARGLPGERPAPLLPRTDAPAGRWMLSGNEAAGWGRCAVACASSPPTPSPRPRRCWSGWRPRWPGWAARCCRPRTNWPRST